MKLWQRLLATGVPASISRVDDYSAAAAATSHTKTCSLGSGSFVAVLALLDASAGSVSSCTVNGVSATNVAGGTRAAIFVATRTATTGDVVVNLGSSAKMGFIVYALDATSATPTHTATDATANTLATGISVGGCGVTGGTDNNSTFTGSGDYTDSFRVTTSSGYSGLGAIINNATASPATENYSGAGSGSVNQLVGASWL